MKKHRRADFGVSIVCCALIAVLGACGPRTPRTYTIGILNDAPPTDGTMNGFREALTGRDAPAGFRISFIYRGYVGDSPKAAEAEATRILAEKPDAIAAFGRTSILAAAATLHGKGLPVIFAPYGDPVRAGLVESLRHPGGTMTGVYLGKDMGKFFEWIHKVSPSVRRMFIPRFGAGWVSPTDAEANFEEIRAAAKFFAIEPLFATIGSPADMPRAIETLAGQTGILILPTPEQISEFAPFATARGIPIYSFLPAHIGQGALIAYSYDFATAGRQAARLMSMVMRGINPADIPVEKAEYSVTINLKAAGALGTVIPDEVLAQADMVER
jgi:putative ABC transport system substrate-binding protein